jgi:lantibiotic modifying enzyme
VFDPSNHFPLKQLNWSADEARAAAQDIVDDVIGELARNRTLPRHPLDGYGIKSDLYFGWSGIVWGVRSLTDAGVVEVDVDLTSRLDELLVANEADSKAHAHSSNSSYFFGPVSLLMQKYKLLKDGAIADAIYHCIEINNTQPVRELMWGTAGTMLCANFMHRWTAEPRWREIYLFQANRMLAEWEAIDGVGHLWTQDLYGSQKRYLGPVHGFAGNIIPLIEGRELLGIGVYETLAARAMETAVNTARVDNAHANWPGVFDASPRAPVPPRLVQHCHGAAGMITALGKLPVRQNEAFDCLLEKGGELVWSAGPLKKGANLCHGTAGNGYALLRLYERTGNEIWLERARAFAMNSIDQYRMAKESFHQGRYTLWTGDLGTAFFLGDCIGKKANFPTIDVF